jgi:hypothetical protein
LRRERRPHRAGREKGSRGVFGVENWNSGVIVESMSEMVSELRVVSEELQSFLASARAPDIVAPLEALEKCAAEAGKAWSRSWLGYQSRIYYAGLAPPPPGAHFSSEWGLKQLSTMGTRGHWQEFPDGVVEAEIRKRAGNPDVTEARTLAEKGQGLFERGRDSVTSILQTCVGIHDDAFLKKLLEEVEQVKIHARAEFLHHMQPAQFMSRDAIAMSQGLWTPPHIFVYLDVAMIREPTVACEALVKIAVRAFSQLERIEKKTVKADRIGTNVFIGHGRSKEWKDLKDFISERTRLPWDEFNRVPVAGIPNTVRLSTMLDAAAIAFLVMTAEDEKADGTMQARMNVVHEAGLFQGRLGFSRAIVMLEEGCEAFSNIEGLGQIRFPKNNIKAAFHDVQLVLEREGLVEPPEE